VSERGPQPRGLSTREHLLVHEHVHERVVVTAQ